ncbi:cyclic lactone autoinducer peptide [Paenibacillus tengchongensis]|nr:cyclic lactone autoinducer peptide [Paenibacillus tengchongensis]
MLKLIHRKAVSGLATLLSGVAVLVVSASASVLYVHQPEVPEELLK